MMVKRLAGQMYAAFDGDTVRFVESMAHILYSVVKALNDSNRESFNLKLFLINILSPCRNDWNGERCLKR